jgi:anti-sigma B factor antagonist
VYLTCPRCRLSAFRRPGDDGDDRCPRCGSRATLTLQLDPVGRAPDAFSVDVSRRGATTIVSARGDVDLSTEAGLRSAGADAARHAECVVVDLTDVTFLDSTGIRALVVIRGVVDDNGARMVVVAPAGGPASAVIELCGLEQQLGVVRDLAVS